MDNQPTKEQIRAWMLQRQAHREPPPEPEQIRREVGWTGHDSSNTPQRRFYSPNNL